MANLLMGLSAIGVLVSLLSIQQKTFPDTAVNVVSIGAVYLGAAPEEFERGVCIRIEEDHGLAAAHHKLVDSIQHLLGETLRMHYHQNIDLFTHDILLIRSWWVTAIFWLSWHVDP